MSYPPENPRQQAGADDDRERPETSWLSGSLPDGVGEPDAPVYGGAPPPPQPQPWQTGPAPHPQVGPAPAGYPSGYQQPAPYGSGTPYVPGPPAKGKSSKGTVVAVVLTVVLAIGAGIAAWQFWPEGGDGSAEAEPTCWDPGITGECPQFVGRDAAMYVFPPKDEADESSCEQYTEDRTGQIDETAVDVYRCTFSDLKYAAYITQWSSSDEASNAFIERSDGGGTFSYEERWTVDGTEMGDVLARTGTVVGDFYAQCYDDLPFCMYTFGDSGRAGTGDEGDWMLARDKFDPLSADEVEALNAFLADNPSTTTARPTSTGPSSTTGPSRTTGASNDEITDLNSVERSIAGQLAKGYCFDDLPDLSDALNTPTFVETIPCSDPHLSQVIGFVDITDIGSHDDDATWDRYGQRCEDLMSTENVPEDLQASGAVLVPDPQEMAAGARAVMCLVHHDARWTGSALDGSAAGY